MYSDELVNVSGHPVPWWLSDTNLSRQQLPVGPTNQGWYIIAYPAQYHRHTHYKMYWQVPLLDVLEVPP